MIIPWPWQWAWDDTRPEELKPIVTIEKMSDTDQRWFDSWRGSHYDPNTRKVVIIGNPPPYVIAHEVAHAAQHTERAWLWRAWAWLCATRLSTLAAHAHLLLEIDAHRRATAILMARNGFDEASRRAQELMLVQLVT